MDLLQGRALLGEVLALVAGAVATRSPACPRCGVRSTRSRLALLVLAATETLELFATGGVRGTHSGAAPIDALVLELGDKAVAITPATIFAALYP